MKLHLLTSKLIILFLISALSVINLSAQKNPSLELGIKLMAEANSRYGSTMPLTGLQLIYQKGKHSGLETGLYYRTFRNETIYEFYDPSIGFYSRATNIAERFISIPVLYRYQSKSLNFTAGPSLDLFLSWKDRSNKSQIQVTEYNRSHTVEIGAVASVSKHIPLGKKLILEPEIRFNPIFTDGDPYVNSAFGFACRYKL